MLVKEYMFNWLDYYGDLKLKPSTIAGYEMYIRNYINPFIGDYDITQLTPFIIQNWVHTIYKTGRVLGEKSLNAKTVIQAYRILSKALSNGERLEMLTANPCRNIELPKKKKYNHKYLSGQNDILHFILAFKDTEFFLPVLVAFVLGLRRGELLGLKWSDINFDRKTITISRTIVIDKNNNICEDTTKNESSVRELLVPDFLLSILENSARDFVYIFCKSDGSPINPSSFSKRFGEKRKKLGLISIRFHDLRHSNATFFLSKNIDMKVVQSILGHSTIGTTADIYMHADVNLQKPATTIMNDIFKGYF